MLLCNLLELALDEGVTKAEGGGGEGVEDGGVRVLVVLLAVAIGLGNYTWDGVWFGFILL